MRLEEEEKEERLSSKGCIRGKFTTRSSPGSAAAQSLAASYCAAITRVRPSLQRRQHTVSRTRVQQSVHSPAPTEAVVVRVTPATQEDYPCSASRCNASAL